MKFFKKLPDRILFLFFFCAVFAGFFYITRSLRAIPTGLTHGIYARQMLLNGRNYVRRALFSPDHNIKQVLRGLIQEEQLSISIAIFTLTDHDIAHDLIDAKKRGIRIEIVTDEQTRHAEHSKIPLLMKNNIRVFSFPPKKDPTLDRWQAIMHNKFALFGRSITGKRMLLTGSFNWSISANSINQENVMVLDDQEVCLSYLKQFEIIKQRSRLLNRPKDFCDCEEQLQPIEVLSAAQAWASCLFNTRT